MNLIEQILNQARNILYCPVCNNQYDKSHIKFRGFIDNTYIFQAFCNLNHPNLAVTYLASLHRIDKPISTYFHIMSGTKVTHEMADQVSVILEKHKGSLVNLI